MKKTDLTEMINNIAKDVSKVLNENEISIEELDWVLEQVSKRIYSSTTIQAIY